MNIKIKNLHVSILIALLNSLELKSKESRMRTRFKNILTKHEKDIINPERKVLIDEYAQLDANGQYMVDENDNIIFSKEESIIISENINTLMCEELIIECNEVNEEMLVCVSNIMLNGDFTVSGDYADAYDDWCEEFEQVLEFYDEED